MPLTNLNLEQKKAVKTDLGYNLIIASAGTGKTSTIVGRIYHLIQSGISPKEILLLTFTNKASKEMINRVSKYFGKEIAEQINAGTFHSISYQHIKQFNKNLLLKSISDIKTLFKSIYNKRDFHLSKHKTKVYSYQHLYELYSFYQNVEINKTFDEWLLKQKPKQKIWIDIYIDIIDEYETNKKQLGFMNFNDLLLNMREITEKHGITYKEILVDEYQDTNSLQGSIIEAMQPESLFCVGDYDQSIYAFNGANIEIIGSFKNRYPNAKIFTLTKNYRSTKSILNIANKVIQNNPRLYPKELEVTKKDRKATPKLLKFDDIYEQYIGIAHKILESKFNTKEIAILFRNNSSAEGIEAMLRNLGIKSKRKNGVALFELKEIKSLLNLYTLMLNPKDMVAFVNVIEYGKGIGSAIAKELFDGLMLLGNNNCFKGLIYPNKNIPNPFQQQRTNTQLLLSNYFEELGEVSRFKHLNFHKSFLSNPILKHPKLTEDGANLLYFLIELWNDFQQSENPTEAVNLIFQSKFYSYIMEQIIFKRSLLKNGSSCETNELHVREELKRRVKLIYKLTENYKEHFRFLNAIILGGKEVTQQGDGVNLLTVHGSKGLEFKEVYIIDLMEGRFPNNKLASKAGEIEEERRLFYVAVTRAEEVLYLSYAQYDELKNKTFYPSRFLEEANLI